MCKCFKKEVTDEVLKSVCNLAIERCNHFLSDMSEKEREEAIKSAFNRTVVSWFSSNNEQSKSNKNVILG